MANEPERDARRSISPLTKWKVTLPPDAKFAVLAIQFSRTAADLNAKKSEVLALGVPPGQLRELARVLSEAADKIDAGASPSTVQ